MKKSLFLNVLLIISLIGIAQQSDKNTVFQKGTKVILDTLHYDNAYDDGFGMGSPVSFEVYEYYSAADLAAHASAGNTITRIQFYVKDISSITSIELRLRNDQSSTVYTQAVSSFSTGWNDITLSTPYTITSNDLYIGYYIDCTGGYPVGMDAGPGDPNGNWLIYSGTWYHMNDISAFNCNWNIRAIVEGAAAPSNDATLSDLKVDGTTVSGFNSSTYSYNVVLTYGTTIVPTVTATTNDANANAVINDAASLPGTTDVVVTAEDGTTTLTYSVNFTVAAPSTDATLSDLQVDGSTVAGFSSSIYSYNIELPYGTTIVPTVTATTNDPNANAVVNDAASLPGTTNVVVTAEDGSTILTYSVNFTIATSINSVTADQLGFYPNPATDKIFFYGKKHITIYSLDGKILAKDYSDSFDTSIFCKGFYLLRIENRTYSLAIN